VFTTGQVTTASISSSSSSSTAGGHNATATSNATSTGNTTKSTTGKSYPPNLPSNAAKTKAIIAGIFISVGIVFLVGLGAGADQIRKIYRRHRGLDNGDKSADVEMQRDDAGSVALASSRSVATPAEPEKSTSKTSSNSNGAAKKSAAAPAEPSKKVADSSSGSESSSSEESASETVSNSESESAKTKN